MNLIRKIVNYLPVSADPHWGEAARVPRVQGDLHAEGDAQRPHEEARRTTQGEALVGFST